MTISTLCSTLELIPTHKDLPKTPEYLIDELFTIHGVSKDRADMALHVSLDLLRLLNLIVESDGHIRLAGQTQTYCRNSLVWYIKNDQKILANWDRNGTANDEISLSNLLAQAPYFLKALEERRCELWSKNPLPKVAAREQPCSVVLFKAMQEGKIYLLHQWDQKAECYQLIGGKQRPGEVAEQTAEREVLEEVAQAQLVPGKSLFLNRCALPPIEHWEISRTYGAVTHYVITVFQANLVTTNFQTSESDLWISVDEMLAGKTYNGRKVADLGKSIVKLQANFFSSLAVSMEFKCPLRLSAPISEISPPLPAHDSEAENIALHVSLIQLWRLYLRLNFHDAAVIGSLLLALLSGAVSFGAFVRPYFSKESSYIHRASNTNVQPDASNNDSPEANNQGKK